MIGETGPEPYTLKPGEKIVPSSKRTGPARFRDGWIVTGVVSGFAGGCLAVLVRAVWDALQ